MSIPNPPTPIFPHRCIFDYMTRPQLYDSQWFQRTLGYVLFLNEEVKGRSFQDFHSVSRSCQYMYNFLVMTETALRQSPPIALASRCGNIAFRLFCEQISGSVEAFFSDLQLDSGLYTEEFIHAGKSTAVTAYVNSLSVLETVVSAPLIINGKVINTSGVTTNNNTLPQKATNESCSLVQELTGYFLDCLGSIKRLDYGSGHELAFITLLASLQELGIFQFTDGSAVALLVFGQYLKLVRCIQNIYQLEPAGSKGVWGQDDYQFLPFLLGSAQMVHSNVTDLAQFFLNARMYRTDLFQAEKVYSDAGQRVLSMSRNTVDIATAGEKVSKPYPCLVVRKPVDGVEFAREQRKHGHGYLLADAIAYVSECKTGPMEMHSPMLTNMSQLPSWSAMNGGQMKMYGGEVLSKYPVMQHVLFGSILRFTPDKDTPKYLVHNKQMQSLANHNQDEAIRIQENQPLPPSQRPGISLPPLQVITQTFSIAADAYLGRPPE